MVQSGVKSVSAQFVPPRAVGVSFALGCIRTRSRNGCTKKGSWSRSGTSTTSTNSLPDALPITTTGEKHCLCNEDFAFIVDWLENPNNFSMLHGCGRARLRIGNKFSSKKVVFSQVPVVLHAHGFPREVLTGDNLGKRFNR